MARNAEKAMTALARWHRMKTDEERGPVQRRPAQTSECQDAKQAERWRVQVIKEIAKKISQIQNPGLGEFKLRDLNDEINKMLRIKHHWELRIKELGGPDHKRTAPRMLDREGREVPGNRGYKYFGAAKDLPGVRELFDKPAQDTGRKTRTELARFVDADYYGYMDDDDGVLAPLEFEEGQKAIAAAVEEFKAGRMATGSEQGEEQQETIEIYKPSDPDDDLDDYFASNFPSLQPYGPAPKGGSVVAPVGGEEERKFIAHLDVPSQKDVEEALLRRKKMELLEKYAGETYLAQCQAAKALLG